MIKIQLPISFFIVSDRSMMPAFLTGDHVVVWKDSKLEAGDVVVIKSNLNILKRVEKIDKNLVYVSGDNKAETVMVGPFPIKTVVGKVIYQY